MILKILLVLVSIYEKSVQSIEECGILQNENNPPWNVGIYKGVDSNNLELICLGTVIKHNIIITAAHCLYDQGQRVKNEDFYILSSNKLERNTKESNIQLQKVDKGALYIHKVFKGDVRKGDIVIIKLRNSLNEESLPICIDWDNGRPILNEGDNLRHSNWQNGILKMADVTYMDYEHCQYLVSKSFQALLTSDKICAKSDTGLSDEIDDGSGLIYLNLANNLWYIRGVVSAHDPEKSNIVIYSDIVLYLNWISGITARL